jgi:hypothetical protein
MLNRLKETLLSKTQNAHQAVPELFEYPKLPISQRDCRGSSKILDVKDRREFMLVLCKEMLSILIKMRKEIKSLNLKSSKLTTYTESDEKYLLLKHLYHWAFPQYSYVNKNILLAGLVQFLWDVIHPELVPQPYSFFKIVYKPPEMSEESLNPERGDCLPYRHCYIYMRLFSLLLDNLNILSSLTLSIRRTELSDLDFQSMEDSDFLRRMKLFDEDLSCFQDSLKKKINLPLYVSESPWYTEGTVSKKLTSSLKLEMVSAETCRDLFDFIFHPLKGKQRVAKFVNHCTHLFKDISDLHSFKVLRIIYAASKYESIWLGEFMKQLIIHDVTGKVWREGHKAKRMNLLERAKFCEEVIKDWSRDFGGQIEFDLSKTIRRFYLLNIGDYKTLYSKNLFD